MDLVLCIIGIFPFNSLRSNDAYMRSDDGLSPGRRQAIIWTNAGILLIRTCEINIFIQQNAFKIAVCEMTTILSWPQCVNDIEDAV